MPPRRTRSPSAIDQRQKDLEREQEKIRRDMVRLQSKLVGAPERVAAQRKRQEEEKLARLHAHTRGAFDDVFSASVDRPRPARRGRRPLRRERRAQWLQFLLLLMILSVLVWFLVLKIP
jgi:ferric-dicitrate binding protein FerR (iron transport regulator)